MTYTQATLVNKELMSECLTLLSRGLQTVLELEETHDAGQESIAANDQLHGLDAHSVAISRHMQPQGLQRHV